MTGHIVVIMAWVQFGLGLAVMVGGLALAVAGVDRSSRAVVRWALAGLVTWGAWFAMLGYVGRPDSLPAQAFAAAVAYIVVVRGRQLRGILDGEQWWRPNRVAKQPGGGGHG